MEASTGEFHLAVVVEDDAVAEAGSANKPNEEMEMVALCGLRDEARGAALGRVRSC